MNEILETVKEQFPEVVKEGKVDFELLSLVLFDEVSDLQDELNEKDYQILHIMKQIDEIKEKIK